VEAPPKAPPASVPPRAEQRQAALDAFFAKLKAADDPGEAAAYALAIRRIWAGAGSETANLILQRARAARAQGLEEAASRLLDAAAEIAPEWPLAHTERGAARRAAGDLQGAQDDFEAAVKSDPRNFDALAQLAAVRVERNQKQSALEALRAARALYPANDELKKAEETLRLEVEGRDI
jgi:tetratricopeptide (TPR) repeat protein